MTTSLFGTSGIRGSADELFTKQFSFDIGRTFGQFLTKYNQIGAVAVGMDPRGSSPRIKEALINGLFYERREVIDEGAAPVPSMCYVLHIDPGIAGSIMVSGSHIKADLNGVKFFFQKGEILKSHETEIEEIYNSLKNKVDPIKSKEDPLLSEKAKEEYKDLLRNMASKSYPKWKIVVDAGDGAQSDTFAIVLKELGINVVEQNTTIQGQFFARDTENEEDYAELKERVLKEKADFGIGFDADGDRSIFVDRLGKFVPGDYSASLVARETHGESIVTPITSSSVVEHLGKQVIRTKVGSPYVIEAMKKHNSKFGFEANGGGISGEIMYTRDGGSTAIKLLNILAKTNQTLEHALESLPKYYITKTKIDYKWELKDKIMKGVLEEFKDKKIEDLDGLKIWIDEDSWVLFRSSNNAPEFRIFAESKNEEVSKKLVEDGLALVEKIIKS